VPGSLGRLSFRSDTGGEVARPPPTSAEAHIVIDGQKAKPEPKKLARDYSFNTLSGGYCCMLILYSRSARLDRDTHCLMKLGLCADTSW